MKFQMQKSMKFPRAIGTTLETRTTNMVGSIQIKTTITKVKRTSTRNHGKARTKNHGTKIIKHNMVTRSPSPKILALQLLKMLSIFVPQVLMKEYLMQ